MYIFRMNKNILMKYLGKLSHLNYEKWLFKTMINILMKYLGKLSHLNYEKWLFKTMIRVLIGFLIYAEKLLMYMLHLRSMLD